MPISSDFRSAKTKRPKMIRSNLGTDVRVLLPSPRIAPGKCFGACLALVLPAGGQITVPDGEKCPSPMAGRSRSRCRRCTLAKVLLGWRCDGTGKTIRWLVMCSSVPGRLTFAGGSKAGWRDGSL